MRHVKTISRLGLALAVITPLMACDGGPSPEVQARLDSLQATRDSLTRELAEQNEYVQDLSRRIEEATGDIEGTGVASPEELNDRLTTMRNELETARADLSQARQRIGALGNQATMLRDSLDAVITERDEALAMQRDSIADVVASLDSMETVVDDLTTERTNLADELSAIEEKYYTVYYTVGTRDELLERGIIEEEGGARVLLVLWRAGETLVPARDLDPDQFRAVDFRQTSTIALPAPGTYKIVSRQDIGYVEPSPGEDGRFTGETLRITEPEQFWQSSRFLILVAED